MRLAGQFLGAMMNESAELSAARAEGVAQGRREAIEECARLADLFADENFRMATDTILRDPVLRGDRSAAAVMISEEEQMAGCIHSSMAHAAQNIAAAIRRKS